MIESRLRYKTTILESQFDFTLGQSIMKAIFLLRCLIKKYREACKDFHMVY